MSEAQRNGKAVVGATRSAIIARCRSRSRTKSRRFCQSMKERADLRAVMRLPISAAMVSPPACAASSRRKRRLTSALPSASSTRIAARRSGPSAARLSKVTVFFGAARPAFPLGDPRPAARPSARSKGGLPSGSVRTRQRGVASAGVGSRATRRATADDRWTCNGPDREKHLPARHGPCRRSR